MSNACILLIEDMPEAVTLYSHILADSFRIAAATTMAEATAMLRQFRFDCILLDLKLPNGAGVELIGTIKKLIDQETALVVITGMAEVEKEAFEKLVDDFILKTREGADEIGRICLKSVARVRARVQAQEELASIICKNNGVAKAETQLQKWREDPNIPPYK